MNDKKVVRTAASLMVAAALLTGCASQAAQDVDLGGGPPSEGETKEGALTGLDLTFAGYGGIAQEAQMAALQTFADESGARVLEDGPVEYAKIKAMVDAGSTSWDVADVDSSWAAQECGTLLEPIDLSIVDTSNIPAGLVGECYVPAFLYGNVLVYNPDAGEVTSWEDFFDLDQFPGKRLVYGQGDILPGLLEGALLADGVPFTDLYPLDVDRALSKLDTIRDEIEFYSTGAQSQQLLEGGDVAIGLMWSGRAAAAVAAGANYKPAWGTGFEVMDALVVPKNVKSTDAAMAMLNAYLGPEAQKTMSERSGYAPVHADVTPELDAVQTEYLVTSPEAQQLVMQPDFEYWGENKGDLVTAWTNWVVGG